MTESSLIRVAGVPVLRLTPDGPPLSGDQAALDLVAEALGQDAEMVAVPAQRCPPEFFRLASGVAGSVLQKFVNYRLRLVIVGDISGHTATSTALRDLVRESNRGDTCWFVASQDDLADRLRHRAGPAT